MMSSNVSAETAIDQRRAGAQRDLGMLLKSQAKRINELAAGVLNPERMIQLAIFATRKTKALQVCTIESVVAAVMDAARLGLEPDGVQGALIPYKGTAQFQPMYRGLAALAYRDETVEALEARVAREHDFFTLEEGTAPAIVHKPLIVGEPGVVVVYYAVAHIRGRATFDWMRAAEVLAIRDRSQNFQWAEKDGKTNTPWHTDEVEMGKKTVFKRLMKKLPTGERLRLALEHDNAIESGAILDGELATSSVLLTPPTPTPPGGAADFDGPETQRLLAAVASELTRVGVAQDAGARERELVAVVGATPKTVADFERALGELKKRPTAGGAA